MNIIGKMAPLGHVTMLLQHFRITLLKRSHAAAPRFCHIATLLQYRTVRTSRNVFLLCLVADTQLYERLCPSVCLSVGPSVSPLVHHGD